jgi:serine/threonine protein kinase
VSGKIEKFGKYMLLEKLASGGMAEVFLAFSPGANGVGKFVAIKRILPQFSESAEFIDMFKDEAKVAVNLAHSNIVSIFEFGVELGQFFLAMDYIEGRNLRQFLNRMKKDGNYFSVEQISYIIKEVASGLDHAHRCLDGTTGKPLNIIHRDISPQNIMVSFEGEVKVVDFGIAKAESQMETTKAGTLKGKFGYMSPEQAEGLQVDIRTDVFSLGIVLWELLANDRLFVANNEINTLRKIRDCVVPSLRKINPSVPSELEQIVMKALAKDRNVRYQNCAEFHKDLNRFLNRHFPDFVPQDFASFTKSLFADEIVDTRKRLVQYNTDLQIVLREANSPTQKAASVPVDTVTDAGSMGKAIPVPDNSEFLKISDVSKHNVDLAALKIDTSKLPPKTNFGVATSRGANPNLDYSQRIQRPSTSTGSWIAPVMAIFVLIAGGLLLKGLGINESHLEQLMGHVRELQDIAKETPKIVIPPPQIPDTTDLKQVSLLIVSDPTGAEVFLNGTSTGIITPATVRVETGQPVTFEARLEGYLPASEAIADPQNGQRVSLTLRKAIIGFLDISVMQGGSTLYINDKEVPGRPPVTRLPVEADKPMVVKAYNKATGAFDAIEVKVGANQLQRLTLFPKVPGDGKLPASLPK